MAGGRAEKSALRSPTVVLSTTVSIRKQTLVLLQRAHDHSIQAEEHAEDHGCKNP
jgi:hypothetical protein